MANVLGVTPFFELNLIEFSCLYGKDYIMAEIQLSSYSGLRSRLDALNVPTTSFVEISPSCDLSTLHG